MDKKVISLDHLEPFTKNFYEESRRLIRTAMADHNLVIFVGAGVSLDSGMPSWSKAVSQIADKLNISPNEIDSLKIPNIISMLEVRMIIRSWYIKFSDTAPIYKQCLCIKRLSILMQM